MPERLLRLAALLLCLLAPPCFGNLSVTRGSAAADAPASSQQEADWHYRLTSGETLADVARRFLAPGYEEPQLRRHNNLAASAPLAGSVVRIPLDWLRRQPEPARVTAVSGIVQLVSGYNRRKTILQPDDLIRVGDEILSATGSATLTLGDGSTLWLLPDSRLQFNRMTLYGASGMVDFRLRLDRGGLRAAISSFADPNSRFQISTPDAVASVHGTAFALQADPDGSAVQVTEGVVGFGAPGRAHLIPAGYSAVLSGGPGGLLAIRRLPPPPELKPLPETILSFPQTLEWEAGATGLYRLDIFTADDGRWIENRQIRGTRFDLDQLDNGRYEIQLAALDATGMAGIPATTEVRIALQAHRPTLLAPEPGATIDDDMPEFRWQFNGSNEVARVEISAEDSFRELVATSEWAPETSALPSRPLSPGEYFWRVVTEAGGTSVATSEIRNLIINGALPPTRIISVNYLDRQVRIFWETVENATAYHLQLSEDPEFHSVIREATLTDTTAALRLIPGRRYFVRLKALSEGSMSGRWGPGRELYLD